MALDGGRGGHLRARRGGCARPCPGGPRSCGSTSRRNARPGRGCPGFIPRHIEQPAVRHSKPAAVNTSSSPSLSAWALTCCEPGTTIARTPSATRRPATISRRLAQVADSRIRAGADEDPVERNLGHRGTGLEAHVGERALGNLPVGAPGPSRSGSGTASVTSITCPGFVPQVTIGEMAAASISTSVSKRGALVRRQRAPLLHGGGEVRRRTGPSRRSTRTWSRRERSSPRGRRPRSSCCRSSSGSPSSRPSMVSPAYSTAWPTIPPVPRRPMVARIRSLAPTPAPSSPE